MIRLLQTFVSGMLLVICSVGQVSPAVACSPSPLNGVPKPDPILKAQYKKRKAECRGFASCDEFDYMKARGAALLAIHSGSVDTAIWLSGAFFPDVRPTERLTDSCGRTVRMAFDDAYLQTVLDELPTDEFPADLIPQSYIRESEALEAFPSQCSTEFWQTAAGQLRQSMTAQELDALYLAIEPITHVNLQPLTVADEANESSLRLYRNAYIDTGFGRSELYRQINDTPTGEKFWAALLNIWGSKPRVARRNHDLCPKALAVLKPDVMEAIDRLRNSPDWPTIEKRIEARKRYRQSRAEGRD